MLAVSMLTIDVLFVVFVGFWVFFFFLRVNQFMLFWVNGRGCLCCRCFSGGLVGAVVHVVYIEVGFVIYVVCGGVCDL